MARLAALKPRKKTIRDIILETPTLHPAQSLVERNQARFMFLVAGTKTGKTFYAALWLLTYAWANPNKQCLWVAPYYRVAKIGYKYLKKFLPKGKYKPNDSDLTLTLNNGTTITFLHGERPEETIEGEAYHRIVIDEASKCKEQVFISCRTTTTFTKGQILCVSTPRGKNWFYKYYKLGQKAGEVEHKSFRFKTVDNPYIDPAEVENARRTLSEHYFRQYFLAEFLDAGAVFQALDDVLFDVDYIERPDGTVDWFVEPVEGRTYIMGWDLAAYQDWSVVTVMDATTGEIVGISRFQRMASNTPYKAQIKKVLQIYRAYNADTLIYDATGIGKGVTELLVGLDINTIPFNFTNASKAELVNDLILSIQHKRIKIPGIKVVVDELKAFEMDWSKTGLITYHAPDGEHDDCVCSIALVNSVFCDLNGAGMIIDADGQIKSDEDFMSAYQDELEDTDPYTAFEFCK